jgi:hypothetical protein
MEKIPIIGLYTTYQSKLLEKLKQRFTKIVKQLFLTSSYSYFKYNSRTEYEKTNLLLNN